MADRKISDLATIDGSTVDVDDDFIEIIDTSESSARRRNKKISPLELVARTSVFTQSGTADTETVQTNLRNRIANVKSYGATGDGTTNDAAAINKALAAHDHVYFPPGTYLATSQIEMQDQQVIQGAGKTNTKIKKGFNGDLFDGFADQATLLDIYLDGDGANFTGRLLPIAETSTKQSAHRCIIKDAAGYCIEYLHKDAGSQSCFVDCEIARYDGLTAGNFSVKIPDTQQLSATPRTFIGIQTNGTQFVDFGGCNSVDCIACWSGGYDYTDDTRAARIVGGRIANISAMNISGAGNVITGCDINPDLTVTANSTGIIVQGNNLTGTITDNGLKRTNLIDHKSVSFTPEWTGSSSNPAIGDGTLRGEYSRNGNTVKVSIEVIMGASTTYGSGTWRFTPPIAPNTVSNTTQVGVALLTDTGTTTVIAVPLIVDSGTFIDIRIPGGLTLVNPTTPFTWAATDVLRLSIEYMV